MYSEHLTEDRRLVILRLLEQVPGYALNNSVIQTSLSRFAHTVSRDVINSDFAWLAEQGLVEVETVVSGVLVATLTGRGADVALGRATVPGVKRPGPA